MCPHLPRGGKPSGSSSRVGRAVSKMESHFLLEATDVSYFTTLLHIFFESYDIIKMQHHEEQHRKDIVCHIVIMWLGECLGAFSIGNNSQNKHRLKVGKLSAWSIFFWSLVTSLATSNLMSDFHVFFASR